MATASVKYDAIIVGAGLSGAVFADRFARVSCLRVLVLDKRDHIAGNCYDYYNEDGQLMNKYGLHLFHCNDDKTYNYINQFSDWIRYDHKVVARVTLEGDGREELVPVPVNMETVNKLCGENMRVAEEMDAWLEKNQIRGEIRNSKDAALARVGKDLYKALFETYTYKQWEKTPEELDRSVMERIPVRRDNDPRYFSDKYQVIPAKGYTAFVAAMLDHPLITVQLNTDFFAGSWPDVKWLIYTGPIDHYFKESGLPSLEYRSIRFEEARHEGVQYYQSNVVVNEPGADVAYTRTVEYKHLPQNRNKTNNTTIVREYTMAVGEPYYPVPNPENQEVYKKYQALAEKEEAKEEPRVIFVGRLANYKYKNMNDAILDALELFEARCIN